MRISDKRSPRVARNDAPLAHGWGAHGPEVPRESRKRHTDAGADLTCDRRRRYPSAGRGMVPAVHGMGPGRRMRPAGPDGTLRGMLAARHGIGGANGW